MVTNDLVYINHCRNTDVFQVDRDLPTTVSLAVSSLMSLNAPESDEDVQVRRLDELM